MPSLRIEQLKVTLAEFGHNSFAEFIQWLKTTDIEKYSLMFSSPTYKLKFERYIFPMASTTPQKLAVLEATAWEVLLGAYEERDDLPLFTPSEAHSLHIAMHHCPLLDSRVKLAKKINSLTNYQG